MVLNDRHGMQVAERRVAAQEARERAEHFSSLATPSARGVSAAVARRLTAARQGQTGRAAAIAALKRVGVTSNHHSPRHGSLSITSGTVNLLPSSAVTHADGLPAVENGT